MKSILEFINQSVSKYEKPNFLLLIDVQDTTIGEKYEFKDWGLTTKKCRSILPNIEKLVSICRENNIECIHINTTKWTEKKLTHNINKLYKENPDAMFYQNDNPTSLIKINSSEKKFKKNMYSAFGGTKGDLEKYIKEKYGTNPIGMIAGYYSTGCVNATIIDGFHKGIFWYIPIECIETFDRNDKQEYQKNIKKDWEYMYGHMISLNILSIILRKK